MADEPRTGRAPCEPARRLFFALWPDEAMRRCMAEATGAAVRESGGRPVPAANLHVTVAFLGSVPERQLARLAEVGRGAAAQVLGSGPADEAASGSSLELPFDHLEYWKGAQLLCASTAQPPAVVMALARRLQARLTESGFAAGLESSGSVGSNATRPFRPHVTVARKARRPRRGMELDPVIWSFGELVLVDSKRLPEGSVYTVLGRFPLGI